MSSEDSAEEALEDYMYEDIDDEDDDDAVDISSDDASRGVDGDFLTRIGPGSAAESTLAAGGVALWPTRGDTLSATASMSSDADNFLVGWGGFDDADAGDNRDKLRDKVVHFWKEVVPQVMYQSTGNVEPVSVYSLAHVRQARRLDCSFFPFFHSSLPLIYRSYLSFYPLLIFRLPLPFSISSFHLFHYPFPSLIFFLPFWLSNFPSSSYSSILPCFNFSFRPLHI